MNYVQFKFVEFERTKKPERMICMLHVLPEIQYSILKEKFAYGNEYVYCICA